MSKVTTLGKEYQQIKTVVDSDNNYSCKDCVAKRDSGLCNALPNCIEPYVHYIKTKEVL